MACKDCGYRGFTKQIILKDAKEQSIIRMCESCGDLDRYYLQLKREMGEDLDAQIINMEEARRTLCH